MPAYENTTPATVVLDLTTSGTTAERDAALVANPNLKLWDNTTTKYREYYNSAKGKWERDKPLVNILENKSGYIQSIPAGTQTGAGAELNVLHSKLKVQLSSTYSSGNFTVQESIDGVSWADLTGLATLTANTTVSFSVPIKYVRLNGTSGVMTHAGSGVCAYSSTGVLDVLTGKTKYVFDATAHGLAVGDIVGFIGASGLFPIIAQTTNQFTILGEASDEATLSTRTLYTHPIATLLATY